MPRFFPVSLWILTLGMKKTWLIALKGLSIRSALETRGPKVPELQWDVFSDWYEEATKNKMESQARSLRDCRGLGLRGRKKKKKKGKKKKGKIKQSILKDS